MKKMMTMSDNKLYPTQQLTSLFVYQEEFQKKLGYKNVPEDNALMAKHHILGLIGEIGEVLQADQRWKDNGRNEYYDKDEKLIEIADCLIYLVNVCLYSNFSAEELYEAAVKKIDKNFKRLEK